MKRQIVVKLFGEEIVNVIIDETDAEVDEDSEEAESINALNSDSNLSNRSSIGFGDTPWSIDYWDDE